MTSKRFIRRAGLFAFVTLIETMALDLPAYAQGGRGGPGTVNIEPAIRYRIQSDTIKGAPYAAEVSTESRQTLGDGNRIVLRTTGRVYRDGEGRTRREQLRPAGGSEISIVDPVSGVTWSLDPERRVARKMAGPLGFAWRGRGGSAPDQSYQLTVDQLKAQLDYVAAAQAAERALGAAAEVASAKAAAAGAGQRAEQPSGDDRRQFTEETLPVQVMEGVTVQGVRRTTTIAAGAIGNERPIVVTSEEWTSPDLHVLVKTETSDPRVGTSSYRLTNIALGEPDRSLFEVPADYTVLGPLEALGRAGRGGRTSEPR